MLSVLKQENEGKGLVLCPASRRASAGRALKGFPRRRAGWQQRCPFVAEG